MNELATFFTIAIIERMCCVNGSIVKVATPL